MIDLPTMPPPPEEPTERLGPPCTILMGPPGSGKSYSLYTMLAAGLSVFVIATEPRAIETILDACNDHGVSTAKLHWRYCLPNVPTWDVLQEMVQKVNTMTYKQLTDLKGGIETTHTRQLGKLIETLANFNCEHCHQDFGPCDTWDDTNCLVLDSLSGLNILTKMNAVGLKPALHQGEWGVAMATEETILLSLTTALKCYFVMTAHIQREQDEVTLGSIISPQALTKSMGPGIPKFFSECVLTKRNKAEFTWSTEETQNTAVKNRALPISPNLLPTFEPIIEAHERRKKQLEANPQPAPTQPYVSAAPTQ